MFYHCPALSSEFLLPSFPLQTNQRLNPVCSLRDPPTVLPTIMSGLQLYFDRSLGANLLYRFERPQYAEIRKRYITGPTVVVGQEKDMSAVYGAEHLLRMLGEFFNLDCDKMMDSSHLFYCIVSLPQMIASSSMDPESVGILKEYVHELMGYVSSTTCWYRILTCCVVKVYDKRARTYFPG